MSNKYLIFLGCYAAILLVAIIGWIMNIITIFHADSVLDSGVGILRIVGIFVPPLGAILGFI